MNRDEAKELWVDSYKMYEFAKEEGPDRNVSEWRDYHDWLMDLRRSILDGDLEDIDVRLTEFQAALTAFCD